MKYLLFVSLFAAVSANASGLCKTKALSLITGKKAGSAEEREIFLAETATWEECKMIAEARFGNITYGPYRLGFRLGTHGRHGHASTTYRNVAYARKTVYKVVAIYHDDQQQTSYRSKHSMTWSEVRAEPWIDAPAPVKSDVSSTSQSEE